MRPSARRKSSVCSSQPKRRTTSRNVSIPWTERETVTITGTNSSREETFNGPCECLGCSTRFVMSLNVHGSRHYPIKSHSVYLLSTFRCKSEMMLWSIGIGVNFGSLQPLHRRARRLVHLGRSKKVNRHLKGRKGGWIPEILCPFKGKGPTSLLILSSQG